MALKTAAFFFIGCYLKVTHASCSPQQTINCSFAESLCINWAVNSGSYHENYVNNTRFIEMQTCEIKTKNTCSTGNNQHCLELYYKFVINANGCMNFTVGILGSNSQENSQFSIVQSWPFISNTTSSDWVHFQSDFYLSRPVQFYIQISVSVITSDGKVGIRDLLYHESPCSKTTTSSASFTPSTTAPNTTGATATTVTSTSSTTTSSSTTTKSTTATTTTAITTTQKVTSVSSIAETTVTSPSSSPHEGSSSDVGAIVGAVIAVIIVVVAGVVLFLVLRRRRGLHFWKSRFKGNTDNSARTHNVGLSGLPSASVLGRHTTLDSGGGASSTDDFDSDADSFDISFSPSVPYANINKPANRNNTTTGPYDVGELPPAELAPGFEYNHLDLAKKPVKKIGTKSADNYDHIATSKKGIVNTAYSLATNPDGQNSAVASDGTYQEPLKATSVYFVIDNEKGNGESTDGQDIYHMPNEEDKTNYAEIEESASVYHEPNEASARTTNSGYYNVDFARGNVPPPQASAGVYNVSRAQINTAGGIFDVPNANASKPPPSTKPAGINQPHKPGTKKPSAPPKPTHPAPAKPQIAQSKPSATQPKSDAGNSVYHVLHTSSKGETATNGAAAAASSNYEFAEPITVSGNENIPSSSVYNLASATGNRSHPTELLSSAQSSSNNDYYNSLDLEGNKLSQKSAPADMEGGIYSHLTDGDKETYNEVDRHKRTEVIDGEYSHLQQL